MPADLGFPDWSAGVDLFGEASGPTSFLNNVPYAALALDIASFPPGNGRSSIDSSFHPPLVLIEHQIGGYVYRDLNASHGGCLIWPLFGQGPEYVVFWPWPDVTYYVTGYPAL